MASPYEAIGHRYARRSLDRSRGIVGHSSVEAEGTLVAVAVMLLGMSVALDRFLPITVGPLTPTFILMVGLATMGYWEGIGDKTIRHFRAWALSFSAFAIVTLAAANALGSLKSSAGILLWFMAVPGLATICTDRRRFRSLLLGLVIGATVLLVVVVSRYFRGHPMLDEAHPQLLGLNRNAIDLSIVWLIPLVVWSKTFNAPRAARAAFVVASIMWLTNSHGRTGFVALLLVPLVFIASKGGPSSSRGVRVAFVVAVGAILWTSLPILFPNVEAVQRITRYETAKRTTADDIRTLLNKKSIALAKKHPWTGVGFHLYEGQYDPVVETARSDKIHEDALTLPAHNTYYEILATTGVPGFLLFLGALVVPLIAGASLAEDRDIRAALTGYVIVLFFITLHTSYSSIICLPITLTLAAIARARSSADDALTAA